MKETVLTGGQMTVNSIPKNCNFDWSKLVKYLGAAKMIVYSNSLSFKLDKYGDERVKKESSLSISIFDQIRASKITA